MTRPAVSVIECEDGSALAGMWAVLPIDNSSAQDVLRTFTLFGDPALQLVQP